jgi:intracellular sulfur oxidation DsrE/DsrF family protein
MGDLHVNPISKTMRSAMLAIPLLVLAMGAQAEAPHDKSFAEHRLVLQISDSDPAKQNLVLNVANNAIQHYGPEKIDVEIVAFGPGLSLLFADNPQASRIEGLATESGVRFAACANTIAAVTRMHGTAPELNPRAVPVGPGVVRILDLTAEGYTLITP